MRVRKHFEQYLKDTSLHGLRYIGDRAITLFERVFFISIMVAVVFLSGYLISSIWTQWTSSLIIVISPEHFSITSVPFPAVTICSANVAKKSVIEQMIPNSIEYKIAQAYCDGVQWPSNSSETSLFIHNVIEKISHSCEEMFSQCYFGSIIYNCSRLFRPLQTENGPCCTFNSIPRYSLLKTHISEQSEFQYNPWNAEQGFENKTKSNNPYAFPRPFIDNGIIYGLILVLNANTKERYCSIESNSGFVVQVHKPNVQPSPLFLGELARNSHETRISITASLDKASPEVRRLPKTVRNCLFQDEQPLEFFGTYSSSNCKVELYAKAVYTYCDCVLPYMAIIYANATICASREHIECLGSFVKTNTKQVVDNTCLLECSDLTYTTSTSFAPINEHSPLVAATGLPIADCTVLNIFIPTKALRGRQKRAQMTLTDFISSIGGILGLFLGFSLISLVELIYFICIRPYCISRKQQKHLVKPIKKMPKISDPYTDDVDYIPTVYLE